MFEQNAGRVGDSRFSCGPVLNVAFVILIFFAVTTVLSAQVLYGSLTGNVTDPSGAPVAGAQVDVLSVATGVSYQSKTDSSGIYRFVEVLPGAYKITISASSFANAVIQNVIVNVNAVTRANAQLKVAQVKQTVTVTTELPLLQTDRADVHTNLTSTEVQNLPSISSEGASFQGLYKVIPGFSLPMENNSAGGNPQRAMTSNVNGQSTQGNNTTIDGVKDAYPWLPNNIAYVPPTDAIETVNVETNSFDPEQGQAGGAVINVQIKTGTNAFHGDLHELHTDKSLWNLNYFNPPTFKKPENIFNQFGGSIGGPIRKDKLFFFADEESTRQIQAPNSNFQTVPADGLTASAATTQGFFDFRGITDSKGNPVNIYDPRTGNPDGTGRSIITCNGVQNEICLSDVDPAALTMAGLIPPPNETLSCGEPICANNFIATGRGTFHRDDVDSKVDYVLSQKSTIWGRYSLSRSWIFDPGSLGPAEGNASNGGQLGNAFSRIQVVGVGGNYVISPNLLFDINAGFTRQRINAESTDIGTDYGLDVLKIPGTNGPDPLQGGIPAFQFASGTLANLGNPNTGNPFVFRDNQYTSDANMTWIHGKHQVRFGLQFSHTQLNHFQPQGGTFQTARGSFQFTGVGTELAACAGAAPTEQCTLAPGTFDNPLFNSYADFLLGLPDVVGKAVQNIDPIALRWSQWAWYAGDQWQIRPNLTLNYGLRWEFYPMAYSDVGGARVLDPSTMNVLIGGDNSGIPTDDGVDVGHGLFLPRIGVAYRPFQNTVVRAGYGMTGDSNNWRFLRNAYPADTISDFVGNTYPQALGSAFAPAGSLTGLNAVGDYSYLPIGITPIPVSPETPGSYPLPNGVGTTTVPLDFRRGYINDFNLTIEQAFGGGWVGSVGYVGDRAIRPLENININPAPGGGGQAGRILNAEFGGNWSDINQLTPLFNNYYDSLQATLKKRFSDGSVLGFAYTLSKAIDYEDDEEINFILWPYPAYWPRNKALAGFDRTHNFEAYGVYYLPFGNGKRWVRNGVASKIVGGWQLNYVLSAMSGEPFTITDSGSGAAALNAPGNTQTVNLTGPVTILNNTPLSSCSSDSCRYFSTANIEPVTASGVLGNAGRNILRGPGLFNLDTSLYRNFKLTERFTLQFQADAYSVTNTPHFNNPNANISGANFGAITSTLVTTNASLGGSGGQRQWWFGAKLFF